MEERDKIDQVIIDKRKRNKEREAVKAQGLSHPLLRDNITSTTCNTIINKNGASMKATTTMSGKPLFMLKMT